MSFRTKNLMHSRINYDISQKPENFDTKIISPKVLKNVAESLLKAQKRCNWVDCPLKEKISASMNKLAIVLKNMGDEKISWADELFDIYQISFESQFSIQTSELENALFLTKNFVQKNILGWNLNSQDLKKDMQSLKNFLTNLWYEKTLIWLLVFAVFEISSKKINEKILVDENAFQINTQQLFDYCNLFQTSLELDYQQVEALSIFYACSKLLDIS